MINMLLFRLPYLSVYDYVGLDKMGILCLTFLLFPDNMLALYHLQFAACMYHVQIKVNPFPREYSC